MKFFVALACLLTSWSQLALSQERSAVGHVVDGDGKPCANVEVATFWRANGSHKKADGTAFDLSDDSQLREFWGRLGQMAPMKAVVTGDDGSFRISLEPRDRALFAIDAARNRGCIVELPDESEGQHDLVLQLTRLVTVRGTFRSLVESKPIFWSHAYVELLPNVRKPIASDRVVSCGSFDGRFEVRLPPGEYQLNAYAESSTANKTDLRVQPWPSFTVRMGDADLEIGQLDLTLAPPDHDDLVAESKRAGRWTNYTEHYGEPAPKLHAVAGRGIDHERNIDDLRGKWILLDFWSLSCAPCLGRDIPKLMEFYDKNASSRSRFEIIGVCIGSGEIADMAQLDKALSSIETHVWKGRKIPFPIVLDNTFMTWERYGLEALGTVILIDPDGKLVEGDELTLQAILDKADK